MIRTYRLVHGQSLEEKLDAFLKQKGLLAPPGAPMIPEEEPDPLAQLDDYMDRWLKYKGYEIIGKLPAEAPEPKSPMDPMAGWKPIAVTKPGAPTREEIAAGKFAPFPAGPEIPTPEERPREITERPVDYIPPPGWWQQIKDVAGLIRSGDLNAYSVVARGLLVGMTFGNIDPVRLIEKISGQEGFAEEYDREVKRKVQKKLGYTPTVAVKAPEKAAEVAGALLPLSWILKGAGISAAALTKIPAWQALARAGITGIITGLAAKPEDEGILNRIKQVPPSVAFFTVFEAGLLTAQQVAKIVNYNRAAKFYKHVDWDAMPPPPPGEKFFTGQEMKRLFIKMRGNLDPSGLPIDKLTPEELEIFRAFVRKGGWSEAARRGWKTPPGLTPEIPWLETGVPAGLPRKPRFSDIFRRPAFRPWEPGYEPAATRPTPPPPPPPEPPGAPPPGPPGAPPAAAARPRPAERPGAPVGRAAAPAVVVDVTPKPEGGWTYNFKIPTAAPEIPTELTIPWIPKRPPGLPEYFPPEAPPGLPKFVPPEVPIELPEAAPPVAPMRAAPPKEKVFKNPIYQFINFHFRGVRPNPDYSYQALKEVLPFDLIRKDGSPLDIVAQAMKAEFPDIEGDSELYDLLSKMKLRRTQTKFVDRTTGEELVPPQEFFDNELDNHILDMLKAGQEAQLNADEIERARELLSEIPPEQADEFEPDEGIERIRQIIQRRQAEKDKELIKEYEEEAAMEEIVKVDTEKARSALEKILEPDELEEAMRRIVERDVERWPRLPEEKAPAVPEEELRLEREEEVRPVEKPIEPIKKPLLKIEPVKPKEKYPEGFNDLGWKRVPVYQKTLSEVEKASAMGFEGEYGPIGTKDEGYVHITGRRPEGLKGNFVYKSRMAAVPKFGEPRAEQLGLDEETSGDLFAKAKPGVSENLVEALDRLNVPREHRGEVSESVLRNFDPKKGDIDNYIRRILARIYKRKAPVIEKAEEVPTKERGPEYRFAEAEEEVRVIDAITRSSKNDREIEIVRRRIIDEETFEEIGKTLKITRQGAERAYKKVLAKMKEDPEVIRMLENRFKMVHGGPIPKWKEVAKVINTYFKSTKGVSKEVDTANDNRIGNAQAQFFLGTHEARDLEKWLRKNENAGLRQAVKEVLTGERSVHDISLPEGIPLETLKKMRERIDSLSELIMLHGGLSEPTLAAFESGIGKYLGKFYRLYEYLEAGKGKLIKKYWDPPKESRDKFKSALKRDDPEAFGDFSDEEMDNFLEAIVRGEDYIYRGSRRTKRIPTEHYIRRKDLSPEFIEFAGEITDPVWLYLKTITKQSAMAYNAEFLNAIEENYGNLYTFDETTAKRRGWQKTRLPVDYSYGRLRGAWVHPELNAFIRHEVDPLTSGMERMLMEFVVNPFKWTKTIGSIPTHARNFTGNPMFSIMMRNSIINPFNFPYYKKGLKVFMLRNTSMREEWAKIIKPGVTETQFWGAEIPKFYEELLKLDPPSWPEAIYNKTIKWGINKLGNAYNFEDALYRIAAHYKNIEHFGMSEEESVKEINLGMTNYRKLPAVVEILRKYPVFGPFISFRWNVAKIVVNQAVQGGKEIGSKDPKIKVKGSMRLLRLLFVLGIPVLASELSKKVFNVDRKQIKELEQFYPDYRKGGVFVYFRGRNKQLKAYDFTYTWPTGEFIRAFNNLRRGQIKSFTDAIQLFAHPLFDAWSILMQGRDPYWNAKIPGGMMGRMAEIAKLLWIPQSAPIPSIQGLVEAMKTGKFWQNLRAGRLTTYQIETLIDAFHGKPDRYGRVRKLPEELKNFFTGLRTWDVDPKVLILQYKRQKEWEMDELNRENKSWQRKHPRPTFWEEKTHYDYYNKRKLDIVDDMKRVTKMFEELQRGGFEVRKK